MSDNITTGWIKCSERLPAMNERVLATGNGTPFVGAILRDGWTDVHTQSLRLPTHWMPLPAPPEPEKSSAEMAAGHYAYSLSLAVDRQAAKKDFLAGVEWARSQNP